MFHDLSRRSLLQHANLGFAWLAFQSLASGNGLAAQPFTNAPSLPEAPLPHTLPRARRVIFLFMDGGVSHVDTFDPKPELTRLNGQPAKWRPDPRSQAVSAGRRWLGSPWKFDQHGDSGLWVSNLFPHQARVADDLCVIRSLTGETPLHGAQSLLLHTGRSVAAAPSIGSWISWGLGCENQQLPGYVLLNNDWIPNGGFQNFSSSFLPAIHQAALVRARGTPVDNIVPSDSTAIQQAKLKFLSRTDSRFAAQQNGAQEIESAIRNYQTAARMQSLVPGLCDVSGETPQTLSLYGVDRSNQYDQLYALQCLRARRLVEAGVRFVEITCPSTHANNSVHPVFVWIWYHCGFWDGGSHAGSRTVPGDSGLEESMVGDECDAEPGRAAGGCVCGASLWHKILLSPVLTDTALLRPYCRAAVATP